jgi:2-polyprenyl-3-methyl-5-hydroxy-6-metoxy-1,4-benzoquinol methylase
LEISPTVVHKSTALHLIPSSFRDPAGRVLTFSDRIVRIVNLGAVRDLRGFLDSAAFRVSVNRGQLIPTTILGPAEANELFKLDLGDAMVLEHERVSFPSYPYEWPPEMLFQAGLLTLELAARGLPEGLCIKDATPYNILFKAHRPVMVDVLSFERRSPNDAVWLPCAQFVKTFILPLLSNKHFSVRLADIFLNRRDGLEPREVFRFSGLVQSLLPPFLTLATIPTWLGSYSAKAPDKVYRRKLLDDPQKAQFILRRLLRTLRRKLGSVAPRAGRRSEWSTYISDKPQSDPYLLAKRAFVEEAMSCCRPKRVLEVGCNSGHFSALAARSGASVVAIDRDEIVIGDVWRKANADNLDILPLVVDFTRPTPATGWRNQEFPSFIDRARNKFDMVIMLAILHHVLVGERVPLPDVIAHAADLTNHHLLIEFVPPEDEMFRRIARGRDGLFKYLSREVFEAAVNRHFEVVRCNLLEGTSRWIYLLRKRAIAYPC